eukprot:191397-Alexandrium_andersonii.AAC.1
MKASWEHVFAGNMSPEEAAVGFVSEFGQHMISQPTMPDLPMDGRLLKQAFARNSPSAPGAD